MQTHTILIILGAVLLVTGVVGGGLTLKEIKLPSLDKFSRSLAGVVGVVFIVVGVYIEKGTGDAQDRTEEVVEQHQRQEEQRQAEVDSQREEAERKVELERQRREEERRVELEREREEKERLAEIERHTTEHFDNQALLFRGGEFVVTKTSLFSFSIR